MITVEDYLGQHGTGHEDELTDELRFNAQTICSIANNLLAEYGIECALRSGWRPQSVNDATPHAATHSKHITCQAIDIADPDGLLKEWVHQKADDGSHPVLEKYNVWSEFGEATPGWLHIQSVAPGSARRIFAPSADWAARAQNA